MRRCKKQVMRAGEVESEPRGEVGSYGMRVEVSRSRGEKEYWGEKGE